MNVNPLDAYVIGNEVFRTKRDIINRFCRLYEKYKDYELFDECDSLFISYLIRSSCVFISIPTKQFFLIKKVHNVKGNLRREVFYMNVIGVPEKISIYDCVKKLENHHYRKSDEESKMRTAVMLACRKAIQPLIYTLKKSISFPTVSEYSGVLIESAKDVSIDHYDLTFVECVDLFVAQKSYKFRDLYIQKTNGVKPDGNEYYNVKFIDNDLIKDFVHFHNTHTHLRVVTKHENQSTIKLERNGRMA